MRGRGGGTSPPPLPNRQVVGKLLNPSRKIVFVAKPWGKGQSRLTLQNSAWQRFRELRRYIKSLIRSKKREYISKLTSPVKNKPKDVWRFFKSKTTGSSLPDTMFLNAQKIMSAEEKADAFNRYFASIFRPGIPNSHIPPPSAYSQNDLDSISVSTEDMNNLLSSLTIDKATGPDGISARLLKECSDEITPSLTALFNMLLSLGKVPQE